ncbi:MAG: 2-oxo acid dehydrogenase subunit E2 [Planctomycetia bacterium]
MLQFKLPELGENIESADVGQVMVKVGDVVTAGQPVLELETEKAVLELPCPHAGKVTEINVKPGQSIKIGAVVLTLDTAGAGSVATPAVPTKEAPAAKAAPAPAPAKVEAPKPEAATKTLAVRHDRGKPAPAAPATRRLAREMGVDLHTIVGSGVGGRITPADLKGLTGHGANGVRGGGVSLPPRPDFTKFGAVERQTLNKLSQTAAANLTRAWQTIPHVTQHEMVDVGELENRRRQYQATQPKDAPKITVTALTVKAVVAALKAYPQFNASFDTTTNEVVYKRYYNIGIAVDTENGLVVPVVRDADKLTIKEIAKAITELAVKARDRKLDMASMTGGTFTITNLGGIGGTYFTPIVNWPEVAILGMSRSQQVPVLNEGKLETKLMMPLSLSYDHRVVNGADGARFITKLAGLLADPYQLLVEI